MMNDGGPAFPRAAALVKTWDDGEELWETISPDDGMSLRDYFAAKAMQAVAYNLPISDMSEATHDVATRAYKLADAMLKAREAT